MDYLFGELERIIDEIESNDDYSQDDVIQILKKYKEEFEEITDNLGITNLGDGAGFL